MKKAISLLLLVVCICGMMGCEKASGPEVEINYGNSSIYSKEEMDEAIEIIKEAFTGLGNLKIFDQNFFDLNNY